MSTVKFSRLLLLSEREERALEITFNGGVTAIQAGNGFGKSAVIKSLYQTLGATPHKIDKSWQDATVASALEFTVDGAWYRAVHAYGLYGIFDDSETPLIRTSSITKELAPFLARIFNFKLEMSTRENTTITPPPSYIFAPYYVDQDNGWSKPWSSFKDFYLPKSPPTLAEYHSGIKTNKYYSAKAQRDLLQAKRRELDSSMIGLVQAIDEFKDLRQDGGVQLDIGAFSLERDKLVEEARHLFALQAENRREVALAGEERYLWAEQVEVIKHAIKEIDSDFAISLEHSDDVECPVCGTHYANDIVSRFGLVEDKDALLHALLQGNARLAEADAALRTRRNETSIIATSLSKISAILAVRRADVTFGEVIAAEGRVEAIRLLQDKLRDLELEKVDLDLEIKTHQNIMDREANTKRAIAIRSEFNTSMYVNAAKLDVRLADRKRQPIHSAGKARGSEGTREILAYYYAFYEISKKHGSSAFCPIVIDAPNQQGQDNIHLPEILKFIAEEHPQDAQVIVAVEDASALEGLGVEIKNVGQKKRQVLRENEYDRVAQEMREYLAQFLLTG